MDIQADHRNRGEGVAADISMENCAERIERGDPEAEEWLIQTFYGRIYALAVVRTRDREVAQDLTQEIMLAVLQALRRGNLHHRSSLPGYVYATARNCVSYYFRTRKLETGIPEQGLADRLLPDPEESFHAKERKQIVVKAISALGTSEQRILRLTLVEGLKSGEIAERLGLKSEVVRKRKSRAIQKLQKMMRREGSHS